MKEGRGKRRDRWGFGRGSSVGSAAFGAAVMVDFGCFLFACHGDLWEFD